MKKKFGQASLEYLDGIVVRASFTPTWKVDFTERFLQQLQRISPSREAEILQHNADLALAGWFNSLTEIELADRDKLEIISEVVQCKRTLDSKGHISLCVLDYYVVTKE